MFSSYEQALARSRHGWRLGLRRVPTGGEVAGGEEAVKHDQGKEANTLGKAGSNRQRRNPADDEKGRRPWRRNAVLDVRPANTKE
jgi:hypothetical protein